MVVQIIMNKSLTHYGALSVYGESIPLAVAGIINKVAMIFFSLIIGISQGMQPIASFNYGAKKYDRVKGVYKIAIRSGLVVSITAFILPIFPGKLYPYLVPAPRNSSILLRPISGYICYLLF